MSIQRTIAQIALACIDQSIQRGQTLQQRDAAALDTFAGAAASAEITGNTELAAAIREICATAESETGFLVLDNLVRTLA